MYIIYIYICVTYVYQGFSGAEVAQELFWNSGTLLGIPPCLNPSFFNLFPKFMDMIGAD